MLPTREEKIREWVSDLEDEGCRKNLIEVLVSGFGFEITMWGKVDTFIEMVRYAIQDVKEENAKLRDLIRGLDARKLPLKASHRST